MASSDRPLLNPVLSLRVEPTPVDATGGGKNRSQIRESRLATQRGLLSNQFEAIHRENRNHRTYNGRVPLMVQMYDDALAPSKAPGDFFGRNSTALLVAPVRQGYLVEVELDSLPLLSTAALDDETVNSQVDLSNIEYVKLFNEDDVLRKSTQELWDESLQVDGGKLFRIVFTPFRDRKARADVMQHLNALVQDNTFHPINLREKLPLRVADSGEDEAQSSLAAGMRLYRNSTRGQATVIVDNQEALSALACSGSVFRLSPVVPLAVTEPGEGAEPQPDPAPPSALSDPIVGVIDGGLTTRRYTNQIAWRSPPYVSDAHADTQHGNQVSALVIHGYEWNANLTLPKLTCRVGVAQSISKLAYSNLYSPDSFLRYLDRVFASHREVKVWNMSFNEAMPCEEDEFSHLGHEIALLARKYNVLPIISAGNKKNSSETDIIKTRIAAPADCEAGLTVAGRMFSSQGMPGNLCDISRQGCGPQDILKPEISSYSTLRLLGGMKSTATSWSAPIISTLAAHTFENLREPDPDLVRALIINKTDLNEYCPARGWGTPDPDDLPWTCQSNSVTLAWTSTLQPGKDYYWDDLPIPPSLIKEGGIFGAAALTAVLNPKGMTTQGTNANYFSCRLEVALQYKSAIGETQNLLGPMKPSATPEQIARSDHHKWNPIRSHARDFTNRPLTYSGDSFRLRARVYARDLYQYNIHSNEEIAPLPVAFVLTFKSDDETALLYNEMKVSLGTFVESAVIDQTIDVSV